TLVADVRDELLGGGDLEDRAHLVDVADRALVELAHVVAAIGNVRDKTSRDQRIERLAHVEPRGAIAPLEVGLLQPRAGGGGGDIDVALEARRDIDRLLRLVLDAVVHRSSHAAGSGMIRRLAPLRITYLCL